MKLPGRHLQGVSAPRAGAGRAGHAHFWERVLSRRQFVGSGVAAGAVLGVGLLAPKLAMAKGTADPRPIAGGLQLLSPDPTIFHVFVPQLGLGSDPSVITDFTGFVGLSDVAGTGTAKDGTRLFFDTDMRFMSGKFIGLDGKRHHGTFGFLWLDLFTDQAGQNQIHDFNPGIAKSGLFWTIAVDEDALEVELEDGTASFELRRQEIEDYHDLVNALQDGPAVPAHVSFKLEWGGATLPFTASDSTFVFKGLKTEAMIAWSGEEAGFSFRSDPAHTSTNNFSILGHERSGVFR